MSTKICRFTNFSQTRSAISVSFRPDHEEQLAQILEQHATQDILARGQGLSYSDCNLLQQGFLLDTRRLNRILSFDKATGIVVCQPAVTFADLLSLSPNYLPPILPGHLGVTLAGGIANDVHGKNNHLAGSLGQHIIWLELQIGAQRYHCSKQKHADLFYATIAGLGLTGVMTRLALQLKKASHQVRQTTMSFQDLSSLLQVMQSSGVQYDYQVAWLDLLHPFQAILQLANHIDSEGYTCHYRQRSLSIPPIPWRLIHRPIVKSFNHLYYQFAPRQSHILPIWQFNNPLERLKNWPRLYGPHGLLQFQAVFPTALAASLLQQIQQIIRTEKATATLAVLKYFTQSGPGLLSFTRPGFSIAIDFINNQRAVHVIQLLNQLMVESKGTVYLAKDWHLTAKQFRLMYPSYTTLKELLNHYQSPMRSDLSQRLALRPSTLRMKAPIPPSQTRLTSKKEMLSTLSKVGNPSRTWLILGATSAIAESFAKLAAKAGHSLLLIGRQTQALEHIAADLQSRYSIFCEILTVDFTKNLDLIRHIFIKSSVEFDIFIAQSQMVDNAALTVQNITDVITVNITNTIQLIHAYWHKPQQQHQIIFLSSVAAGRGRAKNSLYGASKAAVEVYLEGLQQSATDRQHITIAKLGYIDTHLTYGKPGIFYAATPAACAKACWRNLTARKNAFYYPFFWAVIIRGLQALPWGIYRKLRV